MGAGRPRLLDPAAKPEADRGVRIAGADREQSELAGRDRTGRGGRLSRRGHRRVPLPAAGEDLRVPGGEHPAAGGAPDHRGVHRARPGEAADPGRRRVPAGGGPAADFRSRHRGPAQRRGRGQGLRPVARHRRAAHLPVGPGIRVDTGIATGDAISPDYDSMVAKVIAWGRDRPEAMARLRVRLRETTVVSGRHDDEVVPARTPRPSRGGLRRGRHRVAGPGRAPSRPEPPEHADARCSASRSTCTRPRRTWSASPSCGRPAAAGRAPTTPWAAGRARVPGPVVHAWVCAGRPPAVPDRGRRRGRRGRGRPVSEFESRLVVGGRRHQVVDRAAPAATSSRSTASATG